MSTKKKNAKVVKKVKRIRKKKDDPINASTQVSKVSESKALKIAINDGRDTIEIDAKHCPEIIVNGKVQLLSSSKQIPKELFFGAASRCNDINHGMGQYFDYMSMVYHWRYVEHLAKNSPEKKLERKVERQQQQLLKTQEALEATKEQKSK